MNTLKPVNIALTCVVYSAIITGQIMKNGTAECHNFSLLYILGYTWQDLQLDSLKNICTSYDMTFVVGSYVRRVKRDAFAPITGSQLHFTDNEGFNNGTLYFNADFSKEPFTKISISFNTRIELGDDVRFSCNTTDIHMHRNGLEDIRAGLFRGLTKLRNLDLYGNRIVSLESDFFIDLKELTRLNISDNSLIDLQVGIFRSLTKLRVLDLHANRINSLKSNIFVDSKLLYLLDLSQNNITDLPVGIFRPLSKLPFLYLYGNRIRCLESDIFVGLRELKILDISKNIIVYLMQGLSMATSLEILDLSNNSLRWISSDQFTFHKNSTGHILPEINVIDNQLTCLPYCLTQLKNFYYSRTSSQTYTGQLQPNDTTPDKICEGTAPYTYPADTCEALAEITPPQHCRATDYEETTAKYLTTTTKRGPDGPKSFDWMYIIFIILFFLGVPVLGFIAWWIYKSKAVEDAEVVRLAQKDSELRKKRADLVEVRHINERNDGGSRDLTTTSKMQRPGTSKTLEPKQADARKKSVVVERQRKILAMRTSYRSKAKKTTQRSYTSEGSGVSKETVNGFPARVNASYTAVKRQPHTASLPRQRRQSAKSQSTKSQSVKSQSASKILEDRKGPIIDIPSEKSAESFNTI